MRKFKCINTETYTDISSSALYKYLGWSKSRRIGTSATAGVYKNGVPLLLYLDIFKNYFANTQEDKFYMLKGAGSIELNISDTYQNSDDGYYKIGTDQYSVHFTKTTTIETKITTEDYQRFWDSIKVRVLLSDGSFQTTNLGRLTTNALTKKIILNAVSAEPYATILQFQTTQTTANFIKTNLGQYNLKVPLS